MFSKDILLGNYVEARQRANLFDLAAGTDGLSPSERFSRGQVAVSAHLAVVVALVACLRAGIPIEDINAAVKR